MGIDRGTKKRGTFEPDTTKQGTARGKAGTEGTMSGCSQAGMTVGAHETPSQCSVWRSKGLEARRIVF